MQLDRKKNWEMLSAFKKKYKAGNLPMPNIQWHEEDCDIDLSLQNQKFHAKLLEGGFKIINKIKIEPLFDEMTKADACMFRKKHLYSSSSNDQSITSVLSCWYGNQKLIPPTIIVFDQQYIDEISPGGVASHEFRPIDGKHRLKIAYYFGVTTLSILVLKRQENMIRERLGI